MRGLIFSVLTLLVSSATALAEIEIPKAWREYVRYDQSYNVGQGFYPVPVEDRAPLKIYHLDIPLWAAATHESKFLEEGTREWAYVTKENGVSYARVYFADPSSPALQALARRHGPVQQTFWGVRLQSHNTHLVWDPNTENAAFIKMGVGNGQIWSRNVPSTLKINDFVEATLAANPKIATGILPERFGVQVGEGDDSHVNIIRSAASTRGPPKPGLELLPAHGFLSSPLLETAAKAAGLDKATYMKNVYAPLLARHLAELNYGVGLYPEGHTQNTLLWWNPKTQAIEEFVHRDMTDMAVDTAVEVANRSAPLSHTLEGSNVSRLNRHHVGFLEPHLDWSWAFGPAWINSSYLHEHFWTISTDDRAPIIRAFIESYVEAAESVSGVKIERSRLPALETHPFDFGGRFIYEAVYRQIMEKKFPAIDLKLVDTARAKRRAPALEQTFLERYDLGGTASLDPAFRQKLRDYRNALVKNPHAGKDFSFFYRDGQIIAFDTETGRVLALAHGLTNAQRGPFESWGFRVGCSFRNFINRLQ